MVAELLFLISVAQASEVRFEQKLNAKLPDATFLDESDARVKVSDLSSGKPTVLVFAYYRCPNLCTLVLNGLVDSLRKIPLVLGRDYQVVTISINPNETVSLARAKRNSYLARLGFTPQSAPGRHAWRFLRGESAEIQKLTAAAGFFYKLDAVSKEYSHPSGIIVLSPNGRISQYFLGIQFAPQELERALATAKRGRIGRLAEQILLNCLHFDPNAAKNSAAILLALRFAAVLGAAALAALIARLT